MDKLDEQIMFLSREVERLRVERLNALGLNETDEKFPMCPIAYLGCGGAMNKEICMNNCFKDYDNCSQAEIMSAIILNEMRLVA